MSAVVVDELAGMPGAALRRAREAQGLSLEEISARIRFSVAQLRALESGHWNVLPRGLPLRGMVKAYARQVGLHDQDLLDSLAPGERPGVGLARAFSVADPLVADPARRGGSTVLWLLALAVVALAAALLAYWQGWLVFE
ncbi:helix-turn-helix domain-containing protein [Kerstersia similis]|uniref:helix-turn-helix domain-containing protein n=1 Tax=Kerstersia similis TaxID=206505 RepID=UPI0039F01496